MSNLNTGLNETADQTPGAAGTRVIAETKVKQGRRGTHTFMVLIASLALAVILVFGLWAFKAGDLKAADHRDSASKASAARSFNNGPSQPKAGDVDSKNPT